MIPSSGNSFSPSSQPPYQIAPMARQRPNGITALAILKLLSVILSILVIWLGQHQIQSLQAQMSASLLDQPDDSATVIVGIQDMIDDVYQRQISTLRISQVLTALSIPISLFVAWGLWTMRRWARTWTLAMSWLAVGLGVVGMCLAGEANIPLNMALNGVVIWYLMRQDVQDAFDPGRQTA